MNARHAAALASWLFITPPFNTRTGAPVPQASLADWPVYGSYPTKTQCMNRRAEQIHEVSRNEPPEDPKLERILKSIIEKYEHLAPGTADKVTSYSFEHSLLAQCVQSDDPRLKQSDSK